MATTRRKLDANKYSDAAYCYTLAAAAGKEADACELWACAMTRHAFIEIYERRFGKAVTMLGVGCTSCAKRRLGAVKAILGFLCSSAGVRWPRGTGRLPART
jgi:hypothetical protein